MCFLHRLHLQVLPCLHTFCLNCLSVYLPPESLTITCPLCGQQSILPKRGVSLGLIAGRKSHWDGGLVCWSCLFLRNWGGLTTLDPEMLLIIIYLYGEPAKYPGLILKGHQVCIVRDENGVIRSREFRSL